MKRIVIDPLTRLEGHGRVEIFLDEDGEVANAYLIVPELRGFEQICVGRPAEEMPRITNRLCGLCPEAHHMASAKALDALYGAEPPPAARLIRELFYSAFFVADHATHFFVLAGPDLILGPDAPRATRTVFGVFQAVGSEVARQIIACRERNREVIQMLGGRKIHPAAGLPGGWSVALTEEMRRRVEEIARENVELALDFLRLFESTVLRRPEIAELLVSEGFTDRTYSMGTVDAAGRLNFYDGRIRVVGPEGEELALFEPAEYARHIAERVEPWTFLKLPYLKAVGWKGLVAGSDSGIYCATPLARLNVAAGLATPRAQECYERMFETLGSRRVDGRYRPIHHRLAAHWARLIELLYAAERMLELATDPRIADPDVRASVAGTPSEGVGCVEAPRGTLIHHYRTDAQGILTGVNLIVGTTHNHAPLALSITRAARSLIRPRMPVSEGLLNRIEMVIRSYDPCFSCAAHAFPGPGSLVVTLRDHRGAVVGRLGAPAAATAPA
ncbi:MAG TPA: Ni/Fe hydrogenase subunit alpha [Candidatus Methanoperedens sp.]|nr:Ni/Fe hydrogenase subunit alpha [Candidatus Methanoperedens sp.]